MASHAFILVTTSYPNFLRIFFLDASYYLRAFADLVIIQEEASCAPRECEKVTALYGHGH